MQRRRMRRTWLGAFALLATSKGFLLSLLLRPDLRKVGLFLGQPLLALLFRSGFGLLSPLFLGGLFGSEGGKSFLVFAFSFCANVSD